MRKYFLFALAAMVSLVIASCSEEVLSYNQSDEEVDVVYSINTQSQPITRASHDDDGKAANVNRFICEVWHVNGETSSLYKRVENVVASTANLSTTFNLRLVASQKYKVLFWADHATVTGIGEVREGGATAADLYYTTKTEGDGNKGLQEVSIKKQNDVYVGNEDKMDAFYAVEEIDKLNGSITKTVELKRPFAQLNVITTDIDDIKASSMSTSMEPDQVTLTLNAPTVFNVMEETTVGDPTAISYTAGVYYKTSTKNVKTAGEAAFTYCTLAMSYIFAPADEKAVENVSIKALKESNEITSVDFANIPLQRNYRTNIIGDLLTDGVTYNVTIVPAFTTPDNDVYWTKVATVGDIAAAFAAGKTNVEVLEAPAGDVTIEIPQKYEVADNKESVGIKLPETSHAVEIKYDNDTKHAPSNINVEIAGSTANVTINCLQSHVTLNGGVYNTVEAQTSSTTLVIEKDVTIESLTVKEGGVEIHGSVATLVVNQTSGKTVVFRACEGLSQAVYDVAKDYIDPNFKGVQVGDKWNIVTNDFYQDKQDVNLYHIVSADGFKEFAAAVTNGTAFDGKTIVLDKDIDFQNATITPAGNYSDNKPFKGTFNGNNKKLSNLTVQNIVGKLGVGLFGEVYAPCVIKDLTVENATIIGDKTIAGDKAVAYVGGIAGHGYAKIQNCTFKGKIYAGHQMGGIAGSGGFTITGCTFEGNIISERDWGLGGIIGNCQDGGAISGNTAKGTISAKNANYCGLIAGGIIGCAIYTTYDVKNNYAAMSMTYDGEAFENIYPIVGVYNIDAPGTGNEDFATLITTLANNTWDKTISRNDSYVIKYNNGEPTKTGYVINYGGATTKDDTTE